MIKFEDILPEVHVHFSPPENLIPKMTTEEWTDGQTDITNVKIRSSS